jgi:hypothetical protein
MTKLIIEIDDALLSKALTESQEQQVSLDTFINEALATTLAEPISPIVRKNIGIDTILQSAVEQSKSLVPETEFLLVDICSVEDWNYLSSGERKSLGKDFRKAVEGAEPQIARHVGRTTSNKAIYKRI